MKKNLFVILFSVFTFAVLGIGSAAANSELQQSDELQQVMTHPPGPPPNHPNPPPYPPNQPPPPPSPYPPPGNYHPSRYIRCESYNWGYVQCYTGYQVYRVTLVRQWSAAQCIAYRTFGAYSDSMWVDQGCAGDFLVEYY